MKHYMKLQDIPFENIKEGKQLIENRLNDEKRRLIQVDDTIEFSKIGQFDDTIEVKVLELFYFSTFREMFDSLEDLYPDKIGHTTDEWVEAMREYYSEEEEAKYGVVGIHVELM